LIQKRQRWLLATALVIGILLLFLWFFNARRTVEAEKNAVVVHDDVQKKVRLKSRHVKPNLSDKTIDDDPQELSEEIIRTRVVVYLRRTIAPKWPFMVTGWLRVDPPTGDDALSLTIRDIAAKCDDSHPKCRPELATAIYEWEEQGWWPPPEDALSDPTLALAVLEAGRWRVEAGGLESINDDAATLVSWAKMLLERHPGTPEAMAAEGWWLSRGCTDPRYPLPLSKEELRDRCLTLALTSSSLSSSNGVYCLLNALTDDARPLSADDVAALKDHCELQLGDCRSVDALLAEFGDDKESRQSMARIQSWAGDGCAGREELCPQIREELQEAWGRFKALRGESPSNWREALVGAVWGCWFDEGLAPKTDFSSDSVEVAIEAGWLFGTWAREVQNTMVPENTPFTQCVEARASRGPAPGSNIELEVHAPAQEESIPRRRGLDADEWAKTVHCTTNEAGELVCQPKDAEKN
jgi:hypothetical protein